MCWCCRQIPPQEEPLHKARLGEVIVLTFHLRFRRKQKGGAKDEDAEPESLASLVESTFVLAAAGNSYQMGIKSFISTIKEAYERGYTVPALTMEVSFVPTKVCVV